MTTTTTALSLLAPSFSSREAAREREGGGRESAFLPVFVSSFSSREAAREREGGGAGERLYSSISKAEDAVRHPMALPTERLLA